MQLVPGQDFWQNNIMLRYMEKKGLDKEPGGACFRFACKWLLCKMYDRPFKTYDAALTGRPLTDNFDDESAFDKQKNYLQAVAPHEKPKTDYSVFLAGVRAESRRFLEIWGNKDVKGQPGVKKYAITVTDRVCASLTECRHLFGADVNLVVGIFGTLRTYKTVNGRSVIEGENWAHALAYHSKGALKRFFDSNGGEYDLGSGDPVKEIETYAQRYYKSYWKAFPWLEDEVDIGTTSAPKVVKQYGRDTSKAPTMLYEQGFHTLLNYVLFEAKKK